MSKIKQKIPLEHKCNTLRCILKVQGRNIPCYFDSIPRNCE